MTASQPSSDVNLSGVSIDSSTVEELDVLRFSGIDLESDLGELELQAIVDGNDPLNMLLFIDDGGLYTIFPLHPERPGSGGDATLRLSAGGEQVSEHNLQITGLPPAPGAWDWTIDEMLAGLEIRAGQLGTSLQELSHTAMSDLSDDAAVTKLVASYIDDGSTNDLESLLVRPGSEFSREEVDLVDSIIAKIGMSQLVLPPLDIEPVEAMASSAQTVFKRSSGTSVNAVHAVFAKAASCRTKVIVIEDGDTLKRELARGIAARNALNDPLFQSTGDLASGAASAAGVIAVVGAATGVGAAPAATVAAALGAASAVYTTTKLALEADAGNYPTTFVTLDAAVDIPTFNEDYTEQGNVTKVNVVAASTGFNASESFSSIAAATGMGLAGAVASTAKGAQEFPGLVDATTAGAAILEESAMGEALKSGEEALEFCAQRWTVPIMDTRFVELFAVNNVIKVDDSAMTYEPKKVGNDTLRFETRADFFPGAFAIADVAVETLRLEVVAMPDEIEVKRAGEVIDVVAEIENADTWDLVWETEQGDWVDGMTQVTDSRETTRRLETPTDKDLYPFSVNIESLSETGLRKPPRDDRDATVRITLQNLIVSPDPGKVLKNNQLQFAATSNDGTPREVTWTATGGTIDDAGLYTAGKTPGTFSVTATAVDDPSVSETVTVTIHDGECFIGTWLLRSDEFFDQIGAQFGGEISHRSGENRLVVREDGTYTTVRDAWSYEVASSEGTVVGTITAENSGTWVTTETELSFDEVGGGDVTVELLLEVGGKLVPLPFNAGSTQVPAEPISGTFPYACEEDVFSVDSGGVTSVFDRITD